MKDFDRIRDALGFVPADDRDTWLRMGMAVKAELGEPGFDLWDAWSQASDAYQANDARDVWKSIKAGKVTGATLFHEAKAHGWRDASYQKSTPEELAEQRRQRAERAAAEQARIDQSQGRAAAKAATLWQAAPPAPPDHAYLARKGIGSHGARIGADGWLLIPMQDVVGKLWNLERIAPATPADGKASKKGLYQGRRIGCFFSIGDPEGASALCLAEGFATGASIHEATGLPVAVGFNCGNLGPVAKALRAGYPDLPLIICADDDAQTPGNPGRAKAEAAALAVGGIVVAPVFPGERPDGASDFNDLAQAHGLEAVAAILTGAVAALGAALPVSEAPANPAPGGDTGPIAGITGAAPASATKPPRSAPPSPFVFKTPGEAADTPPRPPSPFPGAKDRPGYVVLDDWQQEGNRNWRPGVYFCGITIPKGEGKPQTYETWISSPLHIEALTFDGQDNNFGRLLRFKTAIGKWRQWSMPMEMLKGSGEDLRGELLAMGVSLPPGAGRSHLAEYLQWRLPQRRMRCALQVGWAGKSFVLPDRVIGPDAAGVIFQSGERGHDEFTLAGTLAGWQAGIAARAVGNPLLGLAIAAGFAGPLLARCNAEGGGIHFVGDSSTGKTTAIDAACSIWGGPAFRRSWRATANGLEGAGTLFNDCLLALDEISECDPRQVGEIVYMIGNGRGKQRASRTGAARGVASWRCFVLSSGERTLATAMQAGSFRAKAGQAVRLLDVPMARTYGAWDALQGASTAAAFSDDLKLAAARHHGHAGRAFLEKLTHDQRNFFALLEAAKGLPLFAVVGGEGQDKRAMSRFALIGLAGELATEYGITGWAEGDAIQAAAEGLRIWRAARGKGNSEKRQIAERLSDFLERHGDGRFSDAKRGDDPLIRERAGWWRDSGEAREYLLTSEGMHEALRGFDFPRGLDALQELGALPAPGADGKRGKTLRIGGRVMRLYAINPEKLGSGDHGH